MKKLSIDENYIQFMDIIELEFFELYQKNQLPLIMKETFRFHQQTLNKSQYHSHIVFLVHGLEGTSCDM